MKRSFWRYLLAAGCLIFVLMNACSWPWIPDFIPGTKASSESDKTAEEEPSGEDLEDEAVYVPREDLAIEDNGRFPIPVSLDVSSCALPVTNANEAVSALTDLSDLFDDPDLPEHIEMTGEHELSGSVFYRFRCLYKDIPVWNEHIVLSTDPGGIAGTISANYRAASSVDDTNVLTDEMIVENAEAFLRDLENGVLEEESVESLEITDIGELSERTEYYYPETPDHLIRAILLPVTFRSGDGTEDQLELLFAAVDGRVLDCRRGRVAAAEPAVGTTTDGSFEADIAYNTEEEKYYLDDLKRNIIVFNGNNQENGFDGSQGSFEEVRSGNPLFGDSKAERSMDYEKGIRLLKMIQELKDFYQNQLNEDLGGRLLFGQYNDGGSSGKNASALSGVKGVHSSTRQGSLSGYGLYVGTHMGIEYDVVAHEFGHLVGYSYELYSGGKESSTVSEAFGDIFSQLSQWGLTGKEPDWVISYTVGSRDLRKSYTGTEDLSKVEPHAYSIKLSHSAYLMYKGGGDHTSPIQDMRTLLNLWYRTLLLMDTVTFMDVRIACEAAAEQMRRDDMLTLDQLNCVRWAFDECGVGYPKAKITNGTFVKGKVDIDVRDFNNKEASDYTIVMRRAGGEDFLEIPKTTPGTVPLNLVPGSYVLTVKDNRGIWRDEKALITVNRQITHGDAVLKIPTTFGAHITGRVWNNDGTALDGVKVSIYRYDSSGKQPFMDTLPIVTTTELGGYYYVNLRPDQYWIEFEKEGYQSIQNIILNLNENTYSNDIILNDAKEEKPEEDAKDVIASGDFGEGLHWQFDKHGVLTISGTGKMDMYGPVPADGGDVTIYDKPWADYLDKIRHIIIKDGVENIGGGAFGQCSILKDVRLPDGIQRIEEFAFWDCVSLKEINIPRSVTMISGVAFMSCDALSDVYFDGFKTDWLDSNIEYSSEFYKATFHYRPYDNWKEGYLDNIEYLTKTDLKESDEMGYLHYSLKDLNHDGIPEVVIPTGFMYMGTVFIFYHDHQVYIDNLSRGFYFDPKSELLLFIDGRQGYYTESIARFTGEGFEWIANGSYETDYPTSDGVIHYYLGEDEVSEEEYYNTFPRDIEASNYRYNEADLTKEELIQKINSYPD